MKIIDLVEEAFISRFDGNQDFNCTITRMAISPYRSDTQAEFRLRVEIPGCKKDFFIEDNAVRLTEVLSYWGSFHFDGWGSQVKQVKDTRIWDAHDPETFPKLCKYLNTKVRQYVRDRSAERMA